MNGMNIDYSLRPVGFVRSRLVVKEDAPKQGSEGAPEAWVEIDPAFGEALDGIAAGQEDTFCHRASCAKGLLNTGEVLASSVIGRRVPRGC
jgi:hypothetical protein